MENNRNDIYPDAAEVRIVPVESMDEMIRLFGVFDENLKIIEDETGARIRTEEDNIRIEGADDSAALAATVVDKLLMTLRRGEAIDRSRIRYAIDLAKEGNAELITELLDDVVAFTNKGRRIKCKTLGQKKYISALKRHTVVFGVGPAGTGKTYLAVAMAVLAYKNKEVEKIILTRPAVEAGEKLGFLPGDLQNKVDPYLRPLYDALYDFLGAETFKSLSERGVIEVAPLAYMRGRTLSDAYIILDEAQNCTMEQMKMFLTRFGEGSRVVVTGDITQIDLPYERKSGLVHALEVLKGVEGIAQVFLTHKDVVRHEMVQRIISAYDRAQHRKENAGR
ncbi:MAG: PhoH family protein [Clostridiales bacterium]|nr:PhoH family protein [Clostridiales bacterium]